MRRPWAPAAPAPATIAATTTPAPPKEEQGKGGVIFLLVILGVGGYAWYNKTPKPARDPVYYNPQPQAVWVNGYYRQNGTFVHGHYRTVADHTDANNWGTSPNVNPYTGQKGSRRPGW